MLCLYAVFIMMLGCLRAPLVPCEASNATSGDCPDISTSASDNGYTSCVDINVSGASAGELQVQDSDSDASDDEPEESNLDNRSSNPITRDQEMLPESDPLDTQVDLSMLTCLHFLAAEKPPPYDWEDDLLVKRIRPFTPPSPPGPRLQEKLGSAADYFQLFFDNDFIQQVSYSVILLYKSYQIF